MKDTEHSLPLLLQPAGPALLRWHAVAVIPLLLASAGLVLVAAWVMPAAYSWQLHSISESAAQGQQHAWVARLSFLCFGTAVLALSVASRLRWARLTYWCLLVFAASMYGAATFSHSPWLAGASNDPVEDSLHSVFASGMGIAFCAAVVARFLQRGSRDVLGRALDAIALLVATVLPLSLVAGTSVGGLAQRTMFMVAYLWFGREAVLGVGLLSKPK